MTAASATAGWPISGFSSSTERDPLAARLDDVLGAVGDLDEAPGVDGADVAGAQPAVVELLGRRVAVVAGGDPRAAHLDLAYGLAVPRQLGAVVVDDAQLDAGQRCGPVLRAPVDSSSGGAPLRRHARRRPSGRGLGHAPALEDGHAVAVSKRLDERSRAPPSRRTRPTRSERQVDRVRLGVARGGRARWSARRREGRALSADQRAERLGLQKRVGQRRDRRPIIQPA